MSRVYRCRRGGAVGHGGKGGKDKGKGKVGGGGGGAYFYSIKITFNNTVGKPGSDKGDFMSRARSLYCHSDTGPTGSTALILREKIGSSLSRPFIRG